MDNIFDLPVSDNPTMDESVDYVDQLVGDGKKFKDVAGLAKGKAESDAYIDILKAKLDEMTKELGTRMSLEKFLEVQKGSTSEKPPVETPTPGSQPQTGLDEATLISKLEELLARRESQKAQETNLQHTQRVLMENFGNKAVDVVDHKAKELGMSPAALKQLAVSSPQAFFQLIGANENHEGVAPVVPRTVVNTTGAPSSTGTRNAAYYERMKNNDPKKYFSNDVTSQMIRDRAQLGDKFYN